MLTENAANTIGPTDLIRSSHPALQINDLHKSFGSTEAVRGVSFTLAQGERLALLGPNGAGKTTLIRMIAGRTKPTSGSIKLLGEPIESPEARNSLGFVPQDLALYADLTARENLAAFGRFHGLRGRNLQDRVKWALQWTGLETRSRELVGSFSGGMKRRINLACGVLHQPNIILLDEPTVGVDPQSRQRIFTMLDELNENGTAILLTTHHLDEAQQSTDRIVIVDKGEVIADGDLEYLIDQTLGSSRMVRVKLSEPITEPLPIWGTRAGRVGKTGERAFDTRIEDIALQLAPLIDAVRSHGYEVTDLEIHSPTLHHVFLHLTGNELRD
ncbi:ABC transporter ATP-binding protein [Stieleria varia]|uniref:Putative ABC transporter ATP-binding protein YxlF n=1 Tax=Stieleria varia TaxID=2528005 RepID=A0A5C6AUK4_9BACT|nr:ABC transporter ATP-binding protein [Stieleria varia]TWU02736.1 putative ABC transporter ATP-binding protein YxlF [Stieleria varia]